MDEKRHSPTVPAVERAIELLQVLARAGKPLMLSELSELTTASRSTAFNTLATLQRYGFVEKDERYKTYRLGLGLFELGRAYLDQVSLVPVFHQHARALVDRCAETVKLVIRDRCDVLYLATQEGPHSVRLVALVGSRRAAHVTAVGKVLLAQLSDAELAALYHDYSFAKPTPAAIDSFVRLQQELAVVRTQQVAYDRQESSTGVNCVAAPIRDVSGTVVAAMSIGVPNDRWNEARMAELTALIQQYATTLSLALGWRGVTTAAPTQNGIAKRLRE
ncbi:MAG: IclR family transcriptional regulator [Caldilineaceae bacterium]